MKRLIEYQLTSEEIRHLFSSQDVYDLHLNIFNKKKVCGDSEKYMIARVLFSRGENEESRKMIETIESDSYRRTCLEAYASWVGAKHGEILN